MRTDPADPRLLPYRNLKAQAVAPHADGTCIVEGAEAVRMLLASGWAVQSVLCKPSLQDNLRDALALRPEVPLLVLDKPALAELVGFPIDRGAFACAQRPEPAAGVAWLRQRLAAGGPLRLLALDALHDHWNVGGLVRTARGLGLDAMLLGPGCADAYSRRALRVGLGHAFAFPLVQVADLTAMIAELQGAGLACWAGYRGETAVHVDQLPPQSGRWLLCVGNEDRGVSPEMRAVCRGVYLPMCHPVESFNAHVAASLLAMRLQLAERA